MWHLAYYDKRLAYRWSQLGSTTYANGKWVRVSIEITNTTSRAFGRVRVNGTIMSVTGGNTTVALRQGNGSGPWFPMPTLAPPSSLSVVGAKVDDFVLATPAYMVSLDASASIMVAPAAADASGAAVAGGQAYTVATAVAAPVAASGSAQSAKPVAAPAIIGFGIAPDGRPHLKFTGFVAGVGYRVVRSATVDFSGALEYPAGTYEDVGGGVAVWEGAEPDDPSTGAKFYRVEAIAE